MTDNGSTERLVFYFDPLCPWAWLTSLWAREVRRHRPIEIEWKFFSLAGVNDRDDQWHGPLRICALARREGGNDAVDRAYLALGRLFHERGQAFEEIDRLTDIVEPYLRDVGLNPELARRALGDPATRDDVLAEHTDAVERLRAFGVPWLLVESDEVGFFGPVIGQDLRGDDAVRLWEHFKWMACQPELYELKRGGRKKMTDLHGLSDRFIEQSAGSR